MISLQPVFRCAAKGLLGDVHPPQHHHSPHCPLLDCPLHQGDKIICFEVFFLGRFHFEFFQQVGTLVILVHDCSDHLLEFAKLLKYTGFQHCCDIFFGLFAVTWIVTRLDKFITSNATSLTMELLLFQMRCIPRLDPVLNGS